MCRVLGSRYTYCTAKVFVKSRLINLCPLNLSASQTSYPFKERKLN